MQLKIMIFVYCSEIFLVTMYFDQQIFFFYFKQSIYIFAFYS